MSKRSTKSRRRKKQRLLWATLLVSQTVFLSGCTSVLWDERTFAHYYEPAKPANLRLFYSDQQRDVLVEYDEARDGAAAVQHRSYFADQNTERVNNRRKPHFTSVTDPQNLRPIPITNVLTASTAALFKGLYAANSNDGDSFTLYADDRMLDSYTLPRYVGASRRFKQVLLTPAAVAVDCTIVGAIAALYWGPMALSALSGKSL